MIKKNDDASANVIPPGTPPPIEYATPPTSPKTMEAEELTPAGCDSTVFAFYPKVETEDEKNGTLFPVGFRYDKTPPPPGSVIAIHGHHFDSERWRDISKKADFYGVVVDWDADAFPNKDKDWIQIQIVANGDYYINPLEGHNNPNIVFDLVIDPQEVEVIVPKGALTYEVYGDDYGKNPMRFFKANSEGFYTVKILFGENQCQKCLDPWCILWTDKNKDIESICNEVEGERKAKSNKELRFSCYRRIAKWRYGDLPRGSRRKLGICTETYVRKRFPAEDGTAYGEFERRS